MDQPFKKFNDVAKKIQAPFQEMAELNVKTLQAFNSNYINSQPELTQINKPEDIWAKQINWAVENSHKTLDYLQKAFEIVEKAFFSLAQEVNNTATQ